MARSNIPVQTVVISSVEPSIKHSKHKSIQTLLKEELDVAKAGNKKQNDNNAKGTHVISVEELDELYDWLIKRIKK